MVVGRIPSLGMGTIGSGAPATAPQAPRARPCMSAYRGWARETRGLAFTWRTWSRRSLPRKAKGKKVKEEHSLVPMSTILLVRRLLRKAKECGRRHSGRWPQCGPLVSLLRTGHRRGNGDDCHGNNLLRGISSSLGEISHHVYDRTTTPEHGMDGHRHSNAWALEWVTAENPRAGTLITFAQHIIVTAFGLRGRFMVKTPTHDPKKVDDAPQAHSAS
jgi:hypothetical protein